MNSHDVTIIGGGPAGCVAAITLSRLGRKVLLIEQRTFPRDKVCGECLSSVGIETLQCLGLTPAIRRLGAVNLSHAVLYATNGSTCRIALPRPMWGISRRTMDTALMQSARESGVHVRQPARCEGLEAGRRPAAKVRDLSTNVLYRVESDWIILADGKSALLPNRPHPTGDLGVHATFRLAGCGQAIELFGVRGHYGGLAPIETGLWNCAFSVPAARVAHYRGDLDALMRAVFHENLALRRRVDTGSRVSEWIASPLPRFGVARRWPQGIIPVGNAAAAIEPVGGEGIGLAMRSAHWAAQFIAGANSSRDTSGLRLRFQRLWRYRRFACRAAGMALSLPLAARAMVVLASISENLTAAPLRLVGKFEGATDESSVLTVP